MEVIKSIWTVIILSIFFFSCSVQQCAVNTETKPFQNRGKVWGEKIEKCGENIWMLEYRTDADLHLLAINVK